jgi:hypothetical protein
MKDESSVVLRRRRREGEAGGLGGGVDRMCLSSRKRVSGEGRGEGGEGIRWLLVCSHV